MQVKVCGITRPEDALAASDMGVDALGFIFFRKSPRCISVDKAVNIIGRLPSNVVRVGVFVNEDPAVVTYVIENCRLDMVQLHGDESPEYARSLSASIVIKAVDIRDDAALEVALDYPAAAILVDARAGDSYGGTGRRSNWTAAQTIGTRRPVILAGGLDPGNIGEALTKVRPAAVDFNSGVESAPGIKDHEKMALAIERSRKGCAGLRDGSPFRKRRVGEAW
ncbi:MAG TPA: phosphoribosylanthranilate isomerase [Deltaproteobacteria bacterium]|nr:phosphoribosylanthranilate isomerase [Deltaproteobacteria bacterium]